MFSPFFFRNKIHKTLTLNIKLMLILFLEVDELTNNFRPYTYDDKTYYCVNGSWYDICGCYVSDYSLRTKLDSKYPNARIFGNNGCSREEAIRVLEKMRRDLDEIYNFEYSGLLELSDVKFEEEVHDDKLSIHFTNGSTKYTQVIDRSKTTHEWIELGDDYFSDEEYNKAFDCFWNAIFHAKKNGESISWILPKITMTNRKLKNPQDAIYLFFCLVEYNLDNVYGNHALMTSIAATYGDLFEEHSDISDLKTAFQASNLALTYQKCEPDNATSHWKRNRSRLRRLLYETKQKKIEATER